MILLGVGALLALVAIVGLFQRDRRQSEQAWVAERRELLERIQRPERVPTTEPVAFMVPDIEPDELELIGTIADPKDSEDDSA